MKTTAIVPAYNEEKYIYNVLSTLSRSKLLDEVICINDGSTDNTLQQVKKVKKVSIINLKKITAKAILSLKEYKKALEISYYLLMLIYST